MYTHLVMDCKLSAPLFFSCMVVTLCIGIQLLSAQVDDYSEPLMDPIEAAAVYDVLEAINNHIPWRAMFPGNICTDGPHGIYCDTDDRGVWHVVELNLGWVAESDNNPSCSTNATISPSMIKFTYLKKLLFYRCFTRRQITIPSAVWMLGSALEHLVFIENSALVGSLPSEIGNLVGLHRLVVMKNSLKGSIPDVLGNLTGMVQLVISGNNLTGSIPPRLGGLKRLKILDLSYNQLGGIIPITLGGLSKLRKLDLRSNKLGGNVPISLGGLRQLQLLDLSANNISGGIPWSLSKLTNLLSMQINRNPLGGTLPNFWGNFSSLISLGLASANLQGQIPDSIGDLLNLRHLALDDNKLSGTIPSRLGTLPRVYHMNLSANSLVGLVPFSPGFASKIGRNLQVVGNVGLCYSSELWQSNYGVRGLEPCNDPFSAAIYVNSGEATVMTRLSVSTGVLGAGVNVIVVVLCGWVAIHC